MVEISLECAIVGQAGTFDVTIDDGKKVSVLKDAIWLKIQDKFIHDDKFRSVVSLDLQLFLAQTEGGAWLDGAGAAAVTLDEAGAPDSRDVSGTSQGFKKMDPSLWIKNDKYFGNNFGPAEGDVHVVVVVPEREKIARAPSYRPHADDNDFRPLKKTRLVRQTIAYTGPVHPDEFSVPLDTITAFQLIKERFSSTAVIGHPLYLLFGPRQFGKTTIAYRIMDWLGDDANVKCVFFDLHRSDVVLETTFWNRLGKSLDELSTCLDYDSFMQLVVRCTTRDQKRFCLVVDEMDYLFANKELAIKFLLALRKWKVASYFCGFLGIGSHELVHHHELFRGDTDPSPFNVVNMIRIEPFSPEQMSAFFQLIKPRYEFSQSLQCGIMAYSSGAPGVFGSMIRFTVDHDKWILQWYEWEAWFKLGAFSVYLAEYNNTYHHIQGDLQGLTELEWEGLKYVLENNGILLLALWRGTVASL